MADVTLDSADGRYLVEGLADWIGLWRFVRDARDGDPGATVEAVRKAAMPLIRRLVLDGLAGSRSSVHGV